MAKTQTTVARRAKESAATLVGQLVSYFVLLVVLFAALILIVIPLVTGSATFTVLTSSMAPAYKPGTLLVVKPTPMAELEVGDIITYQLWSGRPEVVTHRIIGFSADQSGEPMVMTKGDNNSAPDPEPVRELQIRGKLLYGVPEVGHVANALGRSDRGRVVQILAAGLVVYGGIAMGRGWVSGRRDRKDAALEAATADEATTEEATTEIVDAETLADIDATLDPDAARDAEDALAVESELFWSGAHR